MGGSMRRILITGAKGFVGRNLVATLDNIREGRDRSFGADPDFEIYAYDLDSAPEALSAYCADCDLVFHLAGVNRPEEESEFMEGNFGFTSLLLDTLEKRGNSCPVMLSSSVQAALDNPYGQSKRAGEDLLRAYAKRTGARAYIYRFPNLFGKWCRPNYNSVVATFCHNIAHGLPIRLDDPARALRLVYIDDAVAALVACMEGRAHEAEGFCFVPVEHTESLGRIAELLYGFKKDRETLAVPDLGDAFIRKLYASYLSYLPEDGFRYPLTAHEDARGSFTEFLRTPERGQFSVNVSRPHIVKGNHWHHTKIEKFLVVSGRGVIRFRRLGSDEVLAYYVSDERPEVVDIPAGYTHHIENLGDTDMVTLMWASECFDPERPDTYALEV